MKNQDYISKKGFNIRSTTRFSIRDYAILGLYAIVLLLLFASCSSSTGNDDTGNTRFGTWEKVSAQQGNYIGLQGHHSKVVAYKRKADTTAIDTSFIDNAGSIDLELKQVPYDNQYTFRVSLTDSFPDFSYEHFAISFSSDSTLFKSNTNSHLSNRRDYSKIDARFEYRCNGKNPDKEYINYYVSNKDSTQQKVYTVRVDGMKDLVDDILPSCKNN